MRYLLESKEGLYTEKRSKFIARFYTVKSEDEAKNYIERVKKEFFDARHHCYAYIIGYDRSIKKYTDDNEPSGTAGKVILDILEKNDIFNAIIVVTRYFGGVKLGMGNLSRAYKYAALSAIDNAINDNKLKSVKDGYMCSFSIDYKYIKIVKNLIKSLELSILEEAYMEKVNLKLIIPPDKKEIFNTKIKNILLTNEDLNISTKIIYYILNDKIYMI